MRVGDDSWKVYAICSQCFEGASRLFLFPNHLPVAPGEGFFPCFSRQTANSRRVFPYQQRWDHAFPSPRGNLIVTPALFPLSVRESVRAHVISFLMWHIAPGEGGGGRLRASAWATTVSDDSRFLCPVCPIPAQCPPADVLSSRAHPTAHAGRGE
ncbi:uncharacterized protein LY79DRAFT_150140 [Colletotrichum navitas]|uniref:Uncharacterized protein n=1 Tax=Colletotrichum navitas TaxID=681940 RepID=A0AAD8VCN7_9PEZI|nr:uncharacterized protein LY79DRAFT_150140 [Colletotrichum navitas]KAK1599735.1 hypothetical protein LY79DRAFT_150140 [Colletotrichum navitas]